MNYLTQQSWLVGCNHGGAATCTDSVTFEITFLPLAGNHFDPSKSVTSPLTLQVAYFISDHAAPI